MKIFQDFTYEPPLKVKINKEIIQASGLIDNILCLKASIIGIINFSQTVLNSDAYPKNYNVAKGFTVFGESCIDECNFKGGYYYTWCNKIEPSSIGTWLTSDYCTTSHKVTHQVTFNNKKSCHHLLAFKCSFNYL